MRKKYTYLFILLCRYLSVKSCRGLIADRKQNYKGTIMAGLVVMAIGYIALSIPITANAGNTSWLLTLTCIALFFIAFGNGLFKGNLQAIVGQMYDNLEAEAATKGEKS